MSSRVRLDELKLNYDRSSVRLSSVLVLIYFNDNKIFTSFILRPEYDGVHSGQIAFPGGRKEDEDKSEVDTAIREAREEVNIESSKINVLGSLSELFIPPSNFLVTPVVACAETRPDFIPQESEVEKIIEANISFLFDESIVKKKILHVRNTKIEAPYFEVDGHVVWGATAMILSELREVIESIN
jgi:8-oxo-dGTP pyrophosphatase MutT (NUDIX family)